jgi:hypothetical protein
MRSMIVDDEEPAQSRLKRLLTAHPEIQAEGKARNGLEAVEEDDRMGPRPVAGRESSGVGRANITQRLNVRASVKLGGREGGGSRVTVLIPRAEVESPA